MRLRRRSHSRRRLRRVPALVRLIRSITGPRQQDPPTGTLGANLPYDDDAEYIVRNDPGEFPRTDLPGRRQQVPDAYEGGRQLAVVTQVAEGGGGGEVDLRRGELPCSGNMGYYGGGELGGGDGILGGC